MLGLICKLVGAYVIGKDVILPLAIIVTDEIDRQTNLSRKMADASRKVGEVIDRKKK